MAITKRLSRDDWLGSALESLSEEGAQGLRTERLARRLGVTTGSFYWHFKDLQDFQDQLIDYWASEMTHHLIAELEGQHSEARSQLYQSFVRIVEGRLSRYETPLRAWALTHQKARDAIGRIDRLRLEYICKLLGQLGFEGTDLQMRARTLLLCVMAEPAFFVDDTEEDRMLWLQMRFEVLTARAPERAPAPGLS